MQNKTLILHGFIVEFDKYNRIKLMFEDDYNLDNKQVSFTKSYILNKSNNPTYDKSPLVDNKHFLINCGKIKFCTHKGEVVSIEIFRQCMVSCLVKINTYNFYKDNTNIKGWNINLISIDIKS